MTWDDLARKAWHIWSPVQGRTYRRIAGNYRRVDNWFCLDCNR